MFIAKFTIFFSFFYFVYSIIDQSKKLNIENAYSTQRSLFYLSAPKDHQPALYIYAYNIYIYIHSMYPHTSKQYRCSCFIIQNFHDISSTALVCSYIRIHSMLFVKYQFNVERKFRHHFFFFFFFIIRVMKACWL